MKNTAHKLLTIAFFAAISSSAYSKGGCDSSNTISGWGAWCGIDTFLSEQDATAAGGQLGIPSPSNNNPTFDSDNFGGKVSDSQSYNWNGYAMFFDIDNEESVLGTLQFDVDESSALLKAVKVSLENGQTITLSAEDFYRQTLPIGGQQSQIIASTNLNTQNESASQTRYVLAGISNTLFSEESFDENGVYIGAIGIADLKQAEQFRGIEDLDSITIGLAGKATSLANMSNLKSIQAYAEYGVAGVAHTSGMFNDVGVFTGQMYVNFGNSTWETGRGFNYQGLNLNSQISVGASGAIEGNQFSSDHIWTKLPIPASVNQEKSTINGTFLGSNANAIAGQANITLDQSNLGQEAVVAVPQELNIKATFGGQLESIGQGQ